MSERAARIDGDAARAERPAAPAAPLIAVRGLVKNFYDGDREIRVLRGLNLEIMPGERVAIVGQSGIGKSTLLHVLGSLEVPTAGSVLFEGQNLFALGPRALAEFRNRKLGFVFQFHYLLADFSALENVMIPGMIARLPENEVRKRAAEVLELVGLGDKLGRRPAELSGGEQQRVAVARAVALRPRLVLADEPTGNLDPHTADEVHQLFRLLNRQLGVTLVIATHNEQLARAMNRTLRMTEEGIGDDRAV
jgi:lipoprotein-releasing system ATP-binding protein